MRVRIRVRVRVRVRIRVRASDRMRRTNLSRIRTFEGVLACAVTGGFCGRDG